MKAKFATITLTGLFACTLALAQTNPPAGEPPVSAAQPAAAPPVAEPPAAAAQPAATAPVTGQPAATTQPASASPAAAVSQINIQDTELTTIIETLARNAGINYILDPKVQAQLSPVGPDGRPTPQPKITIRWDNITAEQALLAVLSNYGLQLVEDPKTKISRIAVKDPAAPDPLLTKIIQLKYISPSNIVASVDTVLTDKRSKVVPDTRSSQLVVVATEKEMTDIEALIQRLDTQTKQVLIEAKILETTLNPKTSKGIDWSGTLANQNVSFGNGIVQPAVTAFQAPGTPSSITTPGGTTISTTPSSSSTTLSPPTGPVIPGIGASGGLVPNGFSANTLAGLAPNIGFLNADGLHAAISFLNTSADTKTISEPRMVTLDNQKATIDVGLLYPIVNTSAGTANTAGGSQISYSNLTVNLDVTPRITANSFVEMKVQQAILKLGPRFTSTVGGVPNSVDSFFTRKLDTTVLIPSANTLVMGGLISDENTSANIKVPILGDIPGLGLLFRHDSKERNRANLIIFLTPTIVQDGDFQPAHTGYLKSTDKEEASEGWTSWDSGKPRDWSKPDTGDQPVFTEPSQPSDAPKAP